MKEQVDVAAAQMEADVQVVFAQAFLEALPANYQSCQSLRLYCEKKLAEEPPKPPKAGEETPAAVAEAADRRGRALGLKDAPDQRLRRVLDPRKLLQEDLTLSKQVEDATGAEGEEKEASSFFAKDRAAWATLMMKRAHLGWCAAALKAREEALTESATKEARKSVPEAGAKPKSLARPGTVPCSSKEIGAKELVLALLLGTPNPPLLASPSSVA